MKGVAEHMAAPEETTEGVEEIVHIEGHQVLGFDAAVQVLIMAVTEALSMIGTMARHTTGPGALIMADTEVGRLSGDQELDG